MVENIRLVIWDLDDTFWKGTLTEGGIREYVQSHHNVVVELARRGIMSSICSKNDHSDVMAILKEQGIDEYFIFPSISWNPKGHRIAQLIEDVQLRPSTVMFIDDNPNNLGEAKAITPDLQVENETFISSILSDPRFQGKDDSSLSRLRQYKLLEQRKVDERKSSGGNEDFLRSCNIRVYVEYDVKKYIDRAVELVNRTNQLNFTKSRLSEDPEKARAELLQFIDHFSRQAGLIRVVDNYGDYGFVGFFVIQGNKWLFHYCWSCRTLGMLIEYWFYEQLGRPEINIVGEVLTDLKEPRIIDWVRRVETLDDSSVEQVVIAPEVRMVGGCEAHSIGVYLKPYTPNLKVWGTTPAGSVLLMVNSLAHVKSTISRGRRGWAREAEELGFPGEVLAEDIFAGAPEGTMYVMNLSLDTQQWYRRYVHKETREELMFNPHAMWNIDFTKDTDEQIRQKVLAAPSPSLLDIDHLLRIAAIIRKEYEVGFRKDADSYFEDLRSFVASIPKGSKIIFQIDSSRVLGKDGSFTDRKQGLYIAMVAELTRLFPYVGCVFADDVIVADSQYQTGGNHYDRLVYFELAKSILAKSRVLAMST